MKTSKKKYYIILILIALSTSMFAQFDNSIIYESIINVEEVSKDDLFDRARVWFVDEFVDANSVLKLTDKEEGILIGKGAMVYKSPVYGGSNLVKGYIKYTVKILVKDNKYKYMFYDFIHEGTPSLKYDAASFGFITTEIKCPRKIYLQTQGWKQKQWVHIKKIIDEKTKRSIKGLEESMNSNSINEW